VKKLYAKINNDLEKELKKINKVNEEIQNIAEQSITIINSKLKELRKIVVITEFKSEKEEIVFFKTMKPKIVSKFMYYVKIFQIESKRPKGNIKIQKKYFETEIKKLQEYFNDNPVLYQYYRRGEVHSDQQFFLRKNKSICIHFDCSGSYIDDDFSTSLDSTFSKFIGYELSIQYLENEIEKLEIDSKTQVNITIKKSNLSWTANKVDLVEIIYAFYFTKSINNGKIDIKEIASTFENVFNIELGDYYRTFLEIKDRRISNTKFLNYLRSKLLKQIEESEK
jgi:hypothetical protein